MSEERQEIIGNITIPAQVEIDQSPEAVARREWARGRIEQLTQEQLAIDWGNTISARIMQFFRAHEVEFGYIAIMVYILGYVVSRRSPW